MKKTTLQNYWDGLKAHKENKRAHLLIAQHILRTATAQKSTLQQALRGVK